MDFKWFVMDMTANTGGLYEFDSEDEADEFGADMAAEGKTNMVFTEGDLSLIDGEYELYKSSQGAMHD